MHRPSLAFPALATTLLLVHCSPPQPDAPRTEALQLLDAELRERITASGAEV